MRFPAKTSHSREMLTAPESSTEEVGELLSLWGETAALKDQAAVKRVNARQWLFRLQQIDFPERLDKVASSEKE